MDNIVAEPEETTGPPITNGELRSRVQNIRFANSTGESNSVFNRIAWFPWILCAIMAFAWALIGIRSYKTVGQEPSTTSTAPTPANTDSESKTELEIKGYIVPARQIAVSPIDVGGKLIKLDFVEGKFYKQGHELALIDPASYNEVVKEAESTLTAARERKKVAESRLNEMDPKTRLPAEEEQIQQELKEAKASELRNLQEYERLKGISGPGVSAREIQQAQADYDGSKARVKRLEATLSLLLSGPRQPKVDAAKAEVFSAEAEVQAATHRLAQAKWRQANCRILMPINGTVLTKKAELYNLVNPMAFGATSGSICDVADLSDLEVEVEVSEREISRLKLNQKCLIRVDAFRDKTYEGRLDRIMPIAIRAKSIVIVRVKILLPPVDPSKGEPEQILKPEMGANVTFLKG